MTVSVSDVVAYLNRHRQEPEMSIDEKTHWARAVVMKAQIGEPESARFVADVAADIIRNTSY